MIDDKDMIEVNLNSKVMQFQDEKIDLHFGESNHCITKSFSNNDLKKFNSIEYKLNKRRKYATVTGVKKNPHKILDKPDISCLRQLHCPDCHQRLDMESVKFETLWACCLPLFPLQHVYQCCSQRSIARKVICSKCGSNIGYWKHS